jgi:hypothetical protein
MEFLLHLFPPGVLFKPLLFSKVQKKSQGFNATILIFSRCHEHSLKWSVGRGAWKNGA